MSRCSRSSITIALVGSKGDLADQLRPEPVVAPAKLLSGLDRVHVVHEPLGGDVEQLADDVLLGDHHVLGALPVAELRVELAGLGVDDVGAQRSRIASEERVGQRAVAPEEAGDVESHEQVHEAVEEAIAERVVRTGRTQHPAIRQGEVEMAGDQHRLQLVAVRRSAGARSGGR